MSMQESLQIASRVLALPIYSYFSDFPRQLLILPLRKPVLGQANSSVSIPISFFISVSVLSAVTIGEKNSTTSIQYEYGTLP